MIIQTEANQHTRIQPLNFRAHLGQTPSTTDELHRQRRRSAHFGGVVVGGPHYYLRACRLARVEGCYSPPRTLTSINRTPAVLSPSLLITMSVYLTFRMGIKFACELIWVCSVSEGDFVQRIVSTDPSRPRPGGLVVQLARLRSEKCGLDSRQSRRVRTVVSGLYFSFFHVFMCFFRIFIISPFHIFVFSYSSSIFIDVHSCFQTFHYFSLAYGNVFVN